ncbi:MAG: alpha/beta hydrolase [Syntrophales bacterium]|nr:alpha/beta hydrolase [Syntrophales bacterium]
MRKGMFNATVSFISFLIILGVLCIPSNALAEKAKDAAQKPKQPVVVMIHGMFVGPWCWDSYRNYFEQRGYRVITPTLKYHDRPLSSPPNHLMMETGILDYVADVEKEIRTLDQKPIIIGHSMGGLIAQILASKGLARATILIAPAVPRGINPISWTGIKSFWMNRQRFGHWREPLRPTFEGALYSFLYLMPPNEQKKVFDKLTYESPRAAWEISFWYFDSHKATYVDESEVTCPILTVVGAQDRLTPPSIAKKIHKKYKSVSTYREFDRHSHFIIAEPGWEEVAQFIEAWIAEHKQRI